MGGSFFVYVVRHGQTAENLRQIIQGQLDTQLNAVGRLEQVPAVARALKDVPFEVCFTSDLSRAVDTAEAILHHRPGVELHKMALLRERYMGNLQGQEWHRRSPPDNTVESSAVFEARTLQFWDEFILTRIGAGKPNPGHPTNVLVVSHGAFIGVLARGLVRHRSITKAPGVEISWCPNVSITLFQLRVDGTGTLLRYGDVSHIMDLALERNVDALPA